MILYQYECEKCNYLFEEFYSVKDRDDPTKEPCKKCGQLEVKRNIGLISKAQWKCEKSTNS